MHTITDDYLPTANKATFQHTTQLFNWIQYFWPYNFSQDSLLSIYLNFCEWIRVIDKNWTSFISVVACSADKISQIRLICWHIPSSISLNGMVYVDWTDLAENTQNGFGPRTKAIHRHSTCVFENCLRLRYLPYYSVLWTLNCLVSFRLYFVISRKVNLVSCHFHIIISIELKSSAWAEYRF